MRESVEKFDIITCFLWNMNYNIYDEIMIKIINLLNSDGFILIGAYDDNYIKEENKVSVKNLLKRYFNSVYELTNQNHSQKIFKASVPKIIE